MRLLLISATGGLIAIFAIIVLPQHVMSQETTPELVSVEETTGDEKVDNNTNDSKDKDKNSALSAGATLAAAVIGLFGVALGALLNSFYFAKRTQDRLWERENVVRTEQQTREDEIRNKLQTREDRIRNELQERDEEIRKDLQRRENKIRRDQRNFEQQTRHHMERQRLYSNILHQSYLLATQDILTDTEKEVLTRDLSKSIAEMNTISSPSVREKAETLLRAVVSSEQSEDWGRRWHFRSQFQDAISEELGLKPQQADTTSQDSQ